MTKRYRDLDYGEDKSDDDSTEDFWPILEFFYNLDNTQSSFALYPAADLNPEILQGLYDELSDTGSLL